jgi:hypothetical protein
VGNVWRGDDIRAAGIGKKEKGKRKREKGKRKKEK